MAENNWLAELIEDMKVLSENTKLNFDVSKFKPVLATIETEIVNQQQLLEAVDRLGEVVGWVQATSEVKTLNGDRISTRSPLLNGEWVAQIDGKDISYLLEYLGGYQWSLQRCTLEKVDPAQANFLAERVTHREVGVKSKRSLVYQKLWCATKSAPDAEMAFFIGFDS